MFNHKSITLLIAVSIANPASADLSADLAAAADAPYLTFTTAGNAPWYVDTTTSVTGNSSIRSGAIGDSQSSSISTTVFGPATLTFDWKVSSEGGYDKLKFNVDSTEQFNISGEIAWQQKTVSIPTGQHTLTWTYSKEIIGSSGADAGWVDNISLRSKPIAAGLYHTCTIKPDLALACWGDDGYGQATAPDGQFYNLTAGSNHNCAIAFSDKSVTCWGDDSYGQTAPPMETFTQVSAGDLHSCGIKADGSLACWGDTAFGQTTVPSGSFSHLDAGDNHTCAVTTAGTVICWGDNAMQQATPPSGTFKYVSAGIDHSCGVKTDGTLACWGDNTFQQSTPPSGNFNQVSAGYWHTCGLKTDNTVVCWGQNYDGQATAPTGSFHQISVNQFHSCGIKTDGSVECWGSNDYGQIYLPQLTVTKTGAGSGTIVSTPAGIYCGSTCKANFPFLGNVTLTATPASNAVFGGWTTADFCTNLIGTCTINLDLDRSVNANFKVQSITTAPVLTGAVAANHRITLSWNPINEATSYNLYKSTTANGQLFTPSKTGLTGSSYTVTGLTNGTPYFYKLIAVNAAGISPVSNEISATPVDTTPAAPLIRAVAGNSQVNLSWAAITGAATYNVYQGISAGGEAVTPVKTGVTGTSVIITGLTNGTRYFFKMKSVSSVDDASVFSNEVNATPIPPRPVAPVLQNAVAGDAQVTLTWGAVPDAATYNVYQGTAAGAQAAAPVKTGVTGTTVSVTGLTNAITYYFKLAAVNAAGVSPKSNEVSATPRAGPSQPVAVTNPATNVTLSSATLNGNIIPNSAATTASFDLGTTTSYGTTVAATPATIAATATATVITATKTGLACNTTYHYRAKGVNSLGTALGADQAFTTATCPLVSYTVTPSAGNGGSVTPNTPQLIAQNATTSFTVTANSGYTTNTAVTGNCPPGSWNGNIWTTGPIIASCNLKFDFTPNSVNAWLNPPNPTVIRDRSFALEVIVKSDSMKVSNYKFTLDLDPAQLQYDTAYQNAAQTCYLGICPSTSALSNRSVDDTDLATGTLILNGQDAQGKGPSNDLQLLTIHLKTKTTVGDAAVTLVTNKLQNPSGGTIGLAARGTTINISYGLCGDSDGNAIVNIVDALSIARTLVNLPPPPTVDITLADTNKNGRLDINDALFIARYSVGLVLPPEACNIGVAL